MAQPLSTDDKRFELLVSAVVDYAIYMLDPQGRVASWNAGAEKIKGYTSSEIVGEHFSRFYTPEEQADGKPARALKIAAETGRFEDEAWRVRKNGERFWALVAIDAIRDEGGTLIGFAKITRDISDRREAQIKLEEAREQLFQAQKMEALGQLTGGLAHDFNNLLTAIISGAELALRHPGDQDRVARFLEGIRGSAQRGASLTRQLLAFARRQPLEAKSVDLAVQLPETVALLRHSVSTEIQVLQDLAGTLPNVDVDPGQLELALLNLGFNARDAMPDGGKLTIRAELVRLSGVEGLHGDFVLIRVSDTGTGIPAEILDRIFEPFFTTKGFGKGTGLGLSQVYGFARQSNGGIAVDSELGSGTSVKLYLPVSGALAEAVRAPTAIHSGRILVVEDDAVVAELAAELLRTMDYEPHVVSSAADALHALSRGEQVDLLFTDVVMPGGMSGLELARKVRERFPELPVLLTTGYSEAVGGSASEFPVLAKPYQFDDLAKALAGLLQPARVPVPS